MSEALKLLDSDPTTPAVAAPVEAPPPTVGDDGAMPLPGDIRTVFLAWLTVLASLAALYAASEIVLPVVLALVLKLLLQPIVRRLEGWHVPKALGAIFAILLLVSAIAAVGGALTGPATAWASRLPEALPKLQGQIQVLAQPLADLQKLIGQFGLIGNGGSASSQPGPLPFGVSGMIGSVFSGTKLFMSALFTTMLVLFYLLVFGEVFLRRVVEILPRFGNKRQAVEISMQIESDLSAYLVTVTAINSGVGTATFLIMWAFGVPDPLLWGVAALLLNYVPILGPMFGILLFCAVGMLSKGVSWAALLPAALYFVVHVAEGEWITPMLLARRFTINPVAIVLALVFWFWMWGVPGAVLAVPMLAITKIICDRIRPLRALGHFLEG
jgi:predicted PurR-regulated permease PerM